MENQNGSSVEKNGRRTGENGEKSNLIEVVYKPTTEGVVKHNEGDLLTPGNEEKEATAVFLYLCVFSAQLLTFTSGIGLSWTSPIIPKLNSTENPFDHVATTAEQAWIAAFLPLGAAVGPFVAGYCVDRLGRKTSLLLIALPMIAGFVVLAIAGQVELYYLARFLVGLGVGSSFGMVPMYTGEVAQSFNRGKFGCFMGVSIVLGMFYPYSIGPYLSVSLYSFTCAVPSVIFLIVFSIFMPETPYYLLQKGRYDQAHRAMAKLRIRGANIQKELNDIKLGMSADIQSKPKLKELVTSRTVRRAMIAAVGLSLLQQLAGINPLLSFLKTIFEASGTQLSPNMCTLIVGLIQIGSNAVCAFVVEHMGRRILFFVSCLGCCIPMTLIGAYFYMKLRGDDVDWLYWLPILCLIAYCVFFSFALGPLPWAIMGEIFPADVKGFATALCSSLNFLMGCAVTFMFPIISKVLGMYGSFWMFGAFCFLGVAFVYFYLPETKGKTLTEIQEMLRSNRKF